MPVRVYNPAVTVTLTRLVNRVSGMAVPTTAAFKQIDLTPYLGTAGSVRTMKDINQAAGGFSVTFADRVNPEFGDTVYALCEPMDLVEIRASRSPQNYGGQTLPLVMRGFVSTVERSESMGQDGLPVRTVTIAGQDSGKLLLINHIYFEIAIIQEKDYLSVFRLQAATGMEIEETTVNDFMAQLISRVVNPKIQQLNVFADAQIQPFILDASVPDGTVTIQMLAAQDMVSVWQLAENFADRPWNELFVEDAEEGPHLVFRPTPYKSLVDGSYIMNGAIDPGFVAVDIADVVALTVMRSDARVANFYWVPPTMSLLNSNASVTANALVTGLPLDFSYDNDTPVLYGVRKMEVQSNLLPTGKPINMLPQGEQAQQRGSVVDWYTARMLQLKLLNRDNSAFEEGGAVLLGNERLTVGQYLRLNRGTLTSEAYITQVSHAFSPLQVWTTSVHFIRGTGFWERNKITSGAPYWMEDRRGPYSA